MGFGIRCIAILMLVLSNTPRAEAASPATHAVLASLTADHGLRGFDVVIDDVEEEEASSPDLASRAAWSVGIWLAGMLVLVLVGVVLSRIALAAAAQPPVEQSGRAQGMAASMRRLYAVVLWLCCGYYYLSIPIVALLVLGLAGGLIVGIFALGYIPIKLIVIIGFIAFVTIGAMAKSLFVRGHDGDPGLWLDLAKHPRLRSVLDEVAAKIGTRPVQTVFMTPGADIAVFERGGMLAQLRGKSERCLLLGVGVLRGMGLTELKAILAHEYGHFSNRDTAGGGFAISVRRSLMTMAMGIARGGAAAWYNPAWLFVTGYHRVFLVISHGASRLQEMLADRWAAFAYGSAAFESGLRHVIKRSVRFDAHTQATLTEVVEHKLSLANLYTYKPKSGVDKREVKNAIEEALEREPSAYDSHPSPKERIAWVRALAAPGATDDGDAQAWDLFSDRDALERTMTAQVRDNVAENFGVRIPGEPKQKKKKKKSDEPAKVTD